MFSPSGLGADQGDLRAGAAVDVGRHGGRGAVRAVDDDVQAVQPGRLGVEQVRAVPLDGVVGEVQPADRGAGGPQLRAGVDRRLDLGLEVVGQLAARRAANSLTPLSGIGLCDADSTTPRSAP